MTTRRELWFHRLALGGLFICGVFGCETRAPTIVLRDLASGRHDGPPLPRPDGPGLDRASLEVDRAVPAADAGLCGPCKPGEVYLVSDCVATDKLFTCAASCNPASASPCPSGFQCDSWGAAPCCYCSAAVPACVPVAAPGSGLEGPLRIGPTSGPAGQEVTLTIRGAAFYIGALWYSVRMGKELVSYDGGGGECRITASFTPPSPGVYPVEVSQYGGGGPWVLAGFYTASGGAAIEPQGQPGSWCRMDPAPGDPTCISAPPYSCGCVGGRCVCH